MTTMTSLGNVRALRTMSYPAGIAAVEAVSKLEEEVNSTDAVAILNLLLSGLSEA